MQRDFLHYQAQTTPHPLGLEISHAQGTYLYTRDGGKYLDFIAGVSANSLGHSHPKVLCAIERQLHRHQHVMVYGEFVQEAPLRLARLLAQHLPAPLETTYLVNSGAEAVEGALKLAKRVTGRREIAAAERAYHGNTQGALSVSGHEHYKRAYRPLIPGTRFIRFNCEADLEKITEKTAAVLLETIQGAAGFICVRGGYLKKVRARCDQVGALLILDEIQSGFGRTGKLFGFQWYDVVPDILVMGKGLGGGMPIGAFSASHKQMKLLSDNPKLGHITTFGGHPLSAAAAVATLEEITESSLMAEALRKEARFRQALYLPEILELRGKGLMLAAFLKDAATTRRVVRECLKRGLILFFLLYTDRALRITPPLTISDAEIDAGCAILRQVLQN